MDTELKHLPQSVIGAGNGSRVSTADLLAAIDLVLGEVRQNREERKTQILELEERTDKELMRMEDKFDRELSSHQLTLQNHVAQNIQCFNGLNEKFDDIIKAQELETARREERGKVKGFIKQEWKWLIVVIIAFISTAFVWIGEVYDLLHRVP